MTGQIVEPLWGPRRTDAVLGAYFLQHLEAVIASDAQPSGGILWWTTWALPLFGRQAAASTTTIP